MKLSRILPIVSASCLFVLGSASQASAFTIGSFRCFIHFSSNSFSITIDPTGVQDFSLDFEFDPTKAIFESIDFKSGYSELSPADLSELDSGLIKNIRGAIGTVPEGNVDLVTLNFSAVPGMDPTEAIFSVFGSDDDQITFYDSDTNTTFVENTNKYFAGIPLSLPNGFIEGEEYASEHVPEPITGLVLAAGLGGAALKRAKNQSKKS